MNDFNRHAATIKHLIATHPEAVDFAEFGMGTSEEWIQRAETRLGVRFPASYRWWLRNYGGGQVYGDELFSIYEMDFDAVVGGDVVSYNEAERKNNQRPANQLVIMLDYLGQKFFLDLALVNGAMEAPVYVSSGEETNWYAPDFFAFLSKQIIE